MLDRLRHAIHALRSLAEIDTLSDRDIADIGLSRGELADLVSVSAEVPVRMARMAALFGVTAADLAADRPSLIEAIGTCAHCGAARTCRSRLAEGSATPASVGFCPNVPLYRDMGRRAH